MEAVAARGRRFEQRGVDQGLQEVLRVLRREVQYGRRRREGDVRAVGQAQQAEGAGLGRFQLAVAQFEGGLDRLVAGLQLVQPAPFVRQLRGQDRDRPGAAGGQPGRGDADRQRQETARADHVERRLPFRGHPLLAHDLREEGQRLLGRHHVQVDQVRPGEVHHPHPCRHQRRAPVRAGQQGPHLGGVAGVVQQDQDTAAVQDGAVEGGALLQGVRDGRVGRAQGPQEGTEHRLRLRGPRARALEVDVQLPVREGGPRPVGDVHREGRLADAADAGQRRDRHHAARRRLPGRGGQYVAQLPDEGRAAGEVGNGRGQLRRAQRGRRGLRGGRRELGQGRVGLEDALLEFLEAGARVDAQLVGEQAARVRVDGERLRLAAAAVQGQHQQLAQAFAQRVRRGQRRQFRDRLGVTALVEVHVEAGFEELEPPFAETDPLRLRVRPRHAGQHLAVPQVQRPAQQVTGVAQVPGAPGLLGRRGQVLGPRQVQRPSARPRTAYPPDSLTSTPGSRTFRSRDAYVRTAASACDGGSSPHRASISSPAVAVRPSRSSRAASSARCCGEPVASVSPSRQARTGPSTPKRSAPDSSSSAGNPGRRCSGTRGPPSMPSP